MEENEQILVKIQDNAIDVADLITKSKNPSAGAISIFLGKESVNMLKLGTTRDYFEEKKVLKLFYEAHPTMAIKIMQKIAEKCKNQYRLNKIIIVHRTGEVVRIKINL
jgi:molybdopterin synthase catalytic subunit